MFLTVSQTRIRYRQSALSEGRTGAVHGGDRLPWVGALDNFRPLTSRGWQVHVYGDAAPALQERCAALGLPLHRFDWHPDADRAGLHRGALYLVRPDGYIGLTDAEASAARLEQYCAEWGLKLGRAP
jgi:hypothetical protein